MSEVTQINPDLSGDRTQLNPVMNEVRGTVINPLLSNDMSCIPETGTRLLGRYEVTEPLTAETGEADLFLCTYEGKTFAAKLYRRAMGIKPEVVEKLMQIKSPHVARLYAYGEWNGRPLEIMEYFPEGSLRGRRYSAQELKEFIIPGINEGLHILHNANILHKDLKPSNIMLRSDGRTVALIDFGISSVETDSSVVVTKTGMTPEYAAPETFRNLFIEESDYYSLGICLCELFSGASPYHNRSAEEIAQFTVLQQVPLPKNMPQPLCELIRALTYVDITHCKDKHNPNRRWSYQDVCDWCEDKELQLPGNAPGTRSQKLQYTFLDKIYPSRTELLHAMTRHWEEGIKEVFRGTLSAKFRNVDPELASLCRAAENDAAETEKPENTIYFQLLVRIGEGRFCWLGHSYESLEALGNAVCMALHQAQDPDLAPFLLILQERLLTAYLTVVHPEDEKALQTAGALETQAILHRNDETEQLKCCWLMGYILSGQKEFILNGQSFWNLSNLQDMLQKMALSNYGAFEQLTFQLMPNAGSLAPQFEAWLTACGYHEEIERWRQGGTDG